MDSKRCNTCNRWYPPTLEFFNAKHTAEDGLTKACTLCLSGNRPRQHAPYTVEERHQRALESRRRHGQKPRQPTHRSRVNESGQQELQCCGCKQWCLANFENFYKSEEQLLGLTAYCKTCHNVRRKQNKASPGIRAQATREKRQQETLPRRLQRQQELEARRQQRLAEKERRRAEIEQKRSSVVDENVALEQSGLRRCDHCKEVYPLDVAHFGSSRSPLSNICYVCRRMQYKDESFRPQALNELRIRATPALWEEHERKRLERAKAQDREKEKKYRQSPKGKRLEQVHTQRRRARRLALPDTLTAQQWNDCLEYFGHACAICGQPAGLFTTLAQDHWIPISFDGEENPGTVVNNVVPLCHSLQRGMNGCNNMKRDQLPHEWLVSTYGARRARQIEARIQSYFDFVSTKARTA